jgi:uncharacterized protein YndB with AHSA1/START domain
MVRGMVTVVDVDAGPTAVARRVEVAAPAAEVFALIADPRQHRELDGSGRMRDLPVVGPERLSVGDSFTVAMEQAGVPYQATSTVTALEDGKTIEWQDGYGRRWRWELSETEAGTTEVTESMEFGTALTPLFDQLSGDTDQHASTITETLQKLAERFAQNPGRPAVCHARWVSPNLRAAS